MPEVVKTPETKHWESFGSCLEIEEESVKVKTEKVRTQSNTKRISAFSVFILVSIFNTRHLCALVLSVLYLQLRFKFSRVRKKFEAPVCFSDRSIADVKKGHIICASYQDSRFSIKQMQMDRGIQAVASLQSSSTQTLRYASKLAHKQNLFCTETSVFMFCIDLPMRCNISLYVLPRLHH